MSYKKRIALLVFGASFLTSCLNPDSSNENRSSILALIGSVSSEQQNAERPSLHELIASSNDQNRLITSANSRVYTLYQGDSSFSPAGIAVDKYTNVYVADPDHNCVRKVDIYGKMTTIVGKSFLPGNKDGAGVDLNVKLNRPSYVAVDDQAKYIYISDTNNHRIRKYDIANDMLSTVVGTVAGYHDGAGTYDVRLNTPKGIDLSFDNKYLFIADYGNNKVRRYDIANDMVDTIVPNAVTIGDYGPFDISASPIPSHVFYNTYDYSPVLTPESMCTVNYDFVKQNVIAHGCENGAVGSGNSLFGGGGLTISRYHDPADGNQIGATFFATETTFPKTKGGVFRESVQVNSWDARADQIGYRDGAFGFALFNHPMDVVQSLGGIVFVSDRGNRAIRFIY
ncbi:beta-propeller fold lactonase family protein [Leptospira kmetyi]|uniref:beta-propeller fold lactonase family protein n=1 Tax=Leptospira kmetyi TaxID=408139 RepID=UPI0002899FDF|nr:beta-propeller fold lactonase family protein [Leptospira kmetyi]EQA53751.1 lactonase, 7-bladed beta-propeller domain protein [Leptospira kmetyi serovar Malaysia str. Bejo-Iso9]